jgi:hypothetical protein
VATQEAHAARQQASAIMMLLDVVDRRAADNVCVPLAAKLYIRAYKPFRFQN